MICSHIKNTAEDGLTEGMIQNGADRQKNLQLLIYFRKMLRREMDDGDVLTKNFASFHPEYPTFDYDLEKEMMMQLELRYKWQSYKQWQDFL